MKTFARRLLRRWLGPLREYRAFRQRRKPLRVGVEVADGYVDALTVHSDGVVSVEGWTSDITVFERTLSLRLDGQTRPPSHVFRVPRPDVERVFQASDGFRGAVAEWILEPHAPRAAALVVEGREALTFAVPRLEATPYGHLHTYPLVVGRDGIYSFGLPVHFVSDEVLFLARGLPAPILDFGCGGGALVRALRRESIEAYGLELDDERIRNRLLDEAKPFVTLYDGSLPAPFADRQFASVTCSEVLEHIPGPDTVVAEMARLASQVLFVTVPDMSSIPRGFPHAVVPWHLLESTHVNFFTQHSLAATLRPYASKVEFSRIGAVQCDRMSYYSSLVVRASMDARLDRLTEKS